MRIRIYINVSQCVCILECLNITVSFSSKILDKKKK